MVCARVRVRARVRVCVQIQVRVRVRVLGLVSDAGSALISGSGHVGFGPGFELLG